MARCAVMDGLAWTDWLPLPHAANAASRRPGVYQARLGDDGPVVYIGMAALRSGRGVAGRLAKYAGGTAPHSGLGRYALTVAMADPAFLRARLAEVQGGRPADVFTWSRLAHDHLALRVRSAGMADVDDKTAVDQAKAVEKTLMGAADWTSLWNTRGRPPV